MENHGVGPWIVYGWNMQYALGVLIFVLALFFTLAGIKDLRRFVQQARTPQVPPDKEPSPISQEAVENEEQWSLVRIIGLCALRFYTGFLSATWLPYLLAMEGQALFGNRQALFMGIAKLIYGVSILLNPIFGLLG